VRAYYAGYFDKAVEYCHENVKTDPENAMVYWQWGRALAQKRDYTNALARLRTAKRKIGGEWPGIDGDIGYVRARQGAADEARKIIGLLRERERNEFVDPYVYAMIYAGLGDADKVFEYLNQACEIRNRVDHQLPRRSEICGRCEAIRVISKFSHA
jgi:tetratricopeptide (TPR) repeat protein